MAVAAKSKRPARKRFQSLFRLYLGDEIALGPGKIDLLRHIAETGSISAAARRMEMSYNRAWLLVRTMNRSFKKPLVLASRGGDRHGGAGLTLQGRQVLELYQRVEQEFTAATRPTRRQLLARLRS